jgi:glycosyltransferase involved in cell wall biosynthesis
VPGVDQTEVVLLSVVISTLNRPEILARCLDALLSGSRLPAEIVVVDQGDAGATAAALDDRRTPRTSFVHVTQARTGLSASQNAGVLYASCPVVSIVDDDCVPDERWVEVAAKQHEVARGPLLLGGRVLPLPAVGDRTIPLALRESTEPLRLDADAMPWDLGTGGNFSVTRGSFLLVGGNDERLGTGTPGRAGNDIDLFRRLMRVGVEARFDPALLVLHERATPAEFRGRSWTYGFGVGACTALWLGDGDRWAVRAFVEWAKMRAWLLQSCLRRRRSVVDEVRVLLGTTNGLWYGGRLAAVSATRRVLVPGPRDRRVDPSRLLKLARHAVAAVARLSDRITLEHPLPTGRTARIRRLLRAGLGDPAHVLVLGHPGPVRQVWPEARLDVVGGDPTQAAVTVVSEARGPGSLPRRWNCVVLTDRSLEADRVSAAVDACQAQGIVAMVSGSRALPVLPPRAEVERVLEARSVRLVLVRVLS